MTKMRSASVWQLFLLVIPCAMAHQDPGLSTPHTARYITALPPLPRKVAYRNPVTTCNRPGLVALTYDDGPGLYTEQLLEILQYNQVKATFFVNGNNNYGPITEGSLPGILKETYAAGHHIGSHTWSHADLETLTREERWQQMESLQETLADIIGVSPTYMRPPYFSCQTDCLQDMADFGFQVVNANLDTKDYVLDYSWSRSTYSTTLSSSSPSASSFIVLVHDIHQETVSTFTQFMIDEARKYGYKLVTLGECLDDAKANWYISKKTGSVIGGNTTANGSYDGIKDVAHQIVIPDPPTNSSPAANLFNSWFQGCWIVYGVLYYLSLL